MALNISNDLHIIPITIEETRSVTDDEGGSVLSVPRSLYTIASSANSSSPIMPRSVDHYLGDEEKNNDPDHLVTNNSIIVDKNRLHWKDYLWPASSKSQSIFFLISILGSAIVLGLQIYIFYVFSNYSPVYRPATKVKSLQTYLTLFSLATVYQLVISYLSLLKKNILQLVILLFFMLAMVIYSGVQVRELTFLRRELHGNWRRATTAAMVLIILILSLSLIFQTILVLTKIRREFGWHLYKTVVGASVELKRLNLLIQSYHALLLFDLFFFPAFTIQFIIINIKRSDPEFYITIAALPITIIILLLAQYTMKNPKRRKLLIICIILYLCGTAYVLFKIIRLYTYLKYHPDGYLPGRISLTAFGVITILLFIATSTMTIVLYFQTRGITSDNGYSHQEVTEVDMIFDNRPKPALIID